MLKPINLDQEVHDRLQSSIDDYIYPILDLGVAHKYRRDFHVCLYQKMSMKLNQMKGGLLFDMVQLVLR